MNRFNTIHLHTRYSDGLNDSHEYIEEAIRLGLKSIGFSDHAPVPLKYDWAMKKEDLPRYFDELNYMRKVYGNKINIYIGLELDYLEGLDVKKYIDFDQLNLDFVIGTVHYLYSDRIDGFASADGTQERVDKAIIEGFGGDGVAFYKKYYQTLRQMITEYNPLMIAHFDIVEKRNIGKKWFDADTDEYKAHVEATLDVIKDSYIEVNTGAMAKDIDVMYPSEYILRRCCAKNIPVSVNSDCHFTSALLFAYDKAIDRLKRAGYDCSYVFDGVMKKVKF